MKRVITVDPRRCLACRTCELECALAHSPAEDLAQALVIEPKPRPRVSLECVEGMCVPLQCRHCEDAPCIAVCPTGALNRANADSPLVVDEKLCIGCRSCLLVCPFGVIELGASQKVITKCDLCVERLARGLLPACVSGCPTGALRLETLDEVTSRARTRAAKEIAAGLRPQPAASETEK